MENATTFVCLLASLPVPPGLMLYGEMYFQAYPMSRFQKGCDDVTGHVQFQLYTSPGDAARNLTLGDTATLSTSGFDRRKRTVLYLHGWGESSTGRSTLTLRDSLLAHAPYNVLIADYLRLTAAPWYDTAVSNTRPIGRHVARFLDFLVEHAGLRMDSLHVISISLGAQVAAATAESVRSGRIGRITGLDPAMPGFGKWKPARRLNKDHAVFVDIIHTDVTVFGVNDSVGHADFYPNGGLAPQPGCQVGEVRARKGSPIEMVFCNHLQAFMFFVTSLQREEAFPATSCDSWTDMRADKCVADGAEVRTRESRDVYMGIATPTWARGDFFLSTKGTKLASDIFNVNVNLAPWLG